MLSIIAVMCYNTLVTAPIPVRKGGAIMDVIISFFVSAAASVAAYYICKWLDGKK